MSCFLIGWSQTVVLFVNKSCIYRILQWNRSDWLHILKWLSFCSGLSVLVSRCVRCWGVMLRSELCIHSHENLVWVHHASYFTPHMLDSISSCLFIKTAWIQLDTNLNKMICNIELIIIIIIITGIINIVQK